MKTINLNKGQVLSIDGVKFAVTENCDLTFEGTIIDAHYSKEDYHHYDTDFQVKCTAINVDQIDPLRGWNPFNYTNQKEDTDAKWMRTYTDVGGHYVFLDDEVIAFLSNGFGDGGYTLRFRNGIHHR